MADLYNYTGDDIVYAYAFDEGEDRWSGDLLGNDVLPDGWYLTVPLPPGAWSFQVVAGYRCEETEVIVASGGSHARFEFTSLNGSYDGDHVCR